MLRMLGAGMGGDAGVQFVTLHAAPPLFVATRSIRPVTLQDTRSALAFCGRVRSGLVVFMGVGAD